MTKILYEDKFIRIFEDKIHFKSWVLPWGKKDVMLSHINKVSERKMGRFSGKSRISGTGNFRDWFHFDLDRPKKNSAIVLETNFKVYKRLWVTPERHGEFLKILKKLLS